MDIMQAYLKNPKELLSTPKLNTKDNMEELATNLNGQLNTLTKLKELWIGQLSSKSSLTKYEQVGTLAYSFF